jgi:hypothetical protein
MATKKKAKKKAVKRPRPAKRKPARRAAARKLPPPLAPLPSPEAPKRNGLWLALIIAGLLVAVLWRNQRTAAVDAPMPQAPEGRSPAAAAPPEAAPRPERTAAPTARRATAGEVGAPSLNFDRSTGQPMRVRCWRPEGGQAQLDVFGPRNQKVRTLTSEAGAAGWQNLDWDGKDEQGKAVPTGLYYLRPSSQGAQQVRDVWVEG